MAPTNKALADAMARAAQPAAPGFTGEFEEYCSPWMTVMITDDNTPEVKVKDLSEGHSYMFRTKAVNGAGPSWPSLPTEELVCKIKKLRPMIDKSSLQPIRVSKGQNITLSAKVQGEPVPFKAWFYGRYVLKTTHELLPILWSRAHPKTSFVTTRKYGVVSACLLPILKCFSHSHVRQHILSVHTRCCIGERVV